MNEPKNDLEPIEIDWTIAGVIAFGILFAAAVGLFLE